MCKRTPGDKSGTVSELLDLVTGGEDAILVVRKESSGNHVERERKKRQMLRKGR